MHRFIAAPLFAALGVSAVIATGGAGETASAQEVQSERAEDAVLYLGWPNDGETVRATRFRIWFGLRNIGIAPAGIARPNTGHHHLIVDAELPPFDEVIPNDPNHLHFGAGQSEAIVELSPGVHTLQLVFADHKHVPHGPPLFSAKKTITIAP